jgi:hypothetical protein
LTQLRKQLHAKIAKAKFPFGQWQRVEDILVQAVSYFRIHRNRQQKNLAPITGRFQFRKQVQKRGPKDKKEIRMYLPSQIHYAWVVGFQAYPNINNKDYPDSLFVIIAESILLGEGVARIHTNLEEFRSYRKKQLEASGFKVVRGKVR